MEESIIQEYHRLVNGKTHTSACRIIDHLQSDLAKEKEEVERLKDDDCVNIDCSNHVQKVLLEKEQLEAEVAELKERIELAADYLPECPDKAKSFLVNPKKGGE